MGKQRWRQFGQLVEARFGGETSLAVLTAFLKIEDIWFPGGRGPTETIERKAPVALSRQSFILPVQGFDP